MNWQGFSKWLLWSLLAILAVIAGAIWVIDPYDNLPFSPPLDRAPSASNQRYSYPAVARNPGFDSLVVGTSTMRLLPPEILNRVFDTRFANLSMNSATAYEQWRIAQVFARHHKRAKYLIVGIDVVWCEAKAKVDKYTFRRFPEWMYDDNAWNDIPHLLEFKTFEVLGRQAGQLLGLREPRYGHDGYRSFLPPRTEYDLEKARQNIYGSADPKPRKQPVSAPADFTAQRAQWTFGSHELLAKMLKAFPDETRKVLVFVPYHRHHQPVEGTLDGARWDECRARIAEMARNAPNTAVQDFMIDSPITSRDENYWDPLHYSNAIAERLAHLIARGLSGKRAPDGEYRVLVPES